MSVSLSLIILSLSCCSSLLFLKVSYSSVHACILSLSPFPKFSLLQTLNKHYQSTAPSPLTSHLFFAYFLHTSCMSVFPSLTSFLSHLSTLYTSFLPQLSAPVLLLPSANPSSLHSHSPVSNLYLSGPPFLSSLPFADLSLIGLLQLHLHDPASCQTDPCLLRLTLSGPESGPEPGF